MMDGGFKKLCSCAIGLSIFAFVVLDGNAQTLTKSSEADGELIFEDSFQDELGPGWTWLREQPARWCVRDGALEIRVRPGLADTVENALLREMPKMGDLRYAIEVKVTNLSKPSQQYEQAGLTWYCDGKPVFKLVKELVDGTVVIIPGKKPIDGDSVHLRLEVQGRHFKALYKMDADQPFQEAGQGEFPHADKVQISLQCYNGPDQEEHWMRFDDFRIWKQK